MKLNCKGLRNFNVSVLETTTNRRMYMYHFLYEGSWYQKRH